MTLTGEAREADLAARGFHLLALAGGRPYTPKGLRAVLVRLRGHSPSAASLDRYLRAARRAGLVEKSISGTYSIPPKETGT